MIIERLVLHNFGPYHGRHVFELMPQPGKPVSILIGLNGAGKTTVLQALQLAFYGAQAPAVEYYANAGGCTFEEYLDQSISYWPKVEHSASVEVEFRAVRGGQERHHLLRRFWKRPQREGGVVNSQKLEVFVDGVADPALASAWPEAIEELLPLPLSTLFFFDGEKIDRWANSLSTAELVTQAVRSLLGLDVIDRALADLQTLKREEAAARQKSADAQEEQALDAALAELGRFVQRRDEIQEQLNSAGEELKREESKLKEMEQQLQSRGLPLLNRRAELLALLEAKGKEILLARERLRNRRVEAERMRRDREKWSEILRRRDTAMMDAAPPKVRAWLEVWLREQATKDFAVTIEASGANENEEGETVGLVTPQAIAGLEKEQRELQALIDQIPDENAVTPLVAKRDEHLRAVERAKLRIEDLNAQLRQVQPLLEREQSRVARLQEQRERAAREKDQTQRLHDAASASAEVLGNFRRKLIERMLDEIAERTQENFATLLHKTDLFDRVRLQLSEKGKDMKFFLKLELGEQPRDPYRFSAGERQMLALSLLWAFAQTSQWRAPVIIDTPLARLDKAHRQNVVNHYMPAAAPQVIVLATDEEATYFQGCPAVCRQIPLKAVRWSDAKKAGRRVKVSA